MCYIYSACRKQGDHRNIADCREEPRVLPQAAHGAGVPHRERHLPQQEAGGVRGQRHAEAHRGDALQPAGQHMEILHRHLQNAGAASNILWETSRKSGRVKKEANAKPEYGAVAYDGQAIFLVSSDTASLLHTLC